MRSVPASLPVKRITLVAPNHARVLGIIMRPDCPNRALVEVFIEELVQHVREAGQATVLTSANR